MASAEELTVLATLRDDMSAGLVKIGAEVDALGRKIDAQRSRTTTASKAMTGYSKTLSDTSKTFDNLGKVVGGPLSGRLTSFSTTLGQLSQTKTVGVLSALGAAGQKLNTQLDLHDRISGLSSDLGGLVGTLAKATAGFGLLGAGVAGFGVKTLAGYQQTMIGLQTLSGSKAAGTSLFGQIQAQTGLFSTSTLGQQAVSMLNQGTPSQVVAQRLKALQDVASVQVDPSSALSSLVSGVNSIQHTGQITSDGLDSLAAAGLPFYDILSKQFGVTKLQVSQLIAQHKIQPQMLLNMIDTESGGLSRFRGQAANIGATTLGGQFSTLKNQAVNQLAGATSPLASVISGQMPGLQRLVTSLTKTLAPAGVSILGSLIGPLSTDLPRALAKIQPLLPGIEKSMGAFAGSLIGLLPNLAKLLADILPILPAAVNLAADLLPVINTFANLLTQYAPLRDMLGGVLLGLLAFNKLSGTVTTIKAVASAISTLAEKLGILQRSEEGSTAAKASSTVLGDAAGAEGGAAAGGGALAGAAVGAGILAGAAAIPFALRALTSGKVANKTTARTDSNIAAARFGLRISPTTGGIENVGAALRAPGAFAVPAATSAHVSAAPAGVSPTSPVIHQTITINGTNMTPQQLTAAIAKANQVAFERGSSSTAATPTTYAMAKTAS